MAPVGESAGIPEQLSRIVMKLLVRLRRADIRRLPGLRPISRACLAAWETDRRIESFRLRTQDISEPLLIPDKLYGRDQEVSRAAGRL